MLSFFSNIKNKIREKLTRKKLLKRTRHYQVVMGSDIYVNTSDSDSSTDTNENLPIHTTPEQQSQLESTRIKLLFGKQYEEPLIYNDYELQTLLYHMKTRCIDIENIKLESRFEELIEKIPNINELFKIKLKILYIMISLNCYCDFFEEKKKYRGFNENHSLGVFRFNDYIIRIDDSPYSFINENDVILGLKKKDSLCDNIVIPFLTYINII